jgi:hypothetical protein
VGVPTKTLSSASAARAFGAAIKAKDTTHANAAAQVDIIAVPMTL